MSKAAVISLGLMSSAVPDRLRSFLHTFNARLDFTTPRTGYVLRSIFAAWLALATAYLLGLHAPYAAASSVLLVISPVQGAVIGKGTWRALGTMAGMLAAIVLMAGFGQMPWLFLLGFGVWLGICVAVMTLLRHFRAYGATLAGYTVGLAAYGALGHPEVTFDQVMGRGSAVLIGVTCLGLVSALFSTRGVHQRLSVQIAQLTSAVARSLAKHYESADSLQAPGVSTRLDATRQRLLTEVYALDDMLAQGKAESADLAQRAHDIRHAMVSLFSALVGGESNRTANDDNRQRLRSIQALQPDLAQTWHDVASAMACPNGSGGTASARKLLLDMRKRLITTLVGPVASAVQTKESLIAGDRLVEQIDDYLAALDGVDSMHQLRRKTIGKPGSSSVPFHRDLGAAVRNGCRALLIVLLGGAFWLFTGWSYGAMMLAGLAAACALLSTAPNPVAGSFEFFKGTAFAVPVAFSCTFLVFPHLQGLPLLMVALALFWLPGIYATTLPRHALAGVAYLVAFTTLSAADNPMRYDMLQFLNGATAWILATLFTLLGFRVVLPRNNVGDIERLNARIRSEVLALQRGSDAQQRPWQWRQQHRMAQLAVALKTQPAVMDRAIADALASLHLGREILRLRQWLNDQSSVPAPAHKVVALALSGMSRRTGDPLIAARHAHRAVRLLARLHETESACPSVPACHADLAAAAFADIATLLDSHSVYFSNDYRGLFHAQ